MARPIRKLVQLVLDRKAARRTESDAKKSLSGVERGLKRLKSAALKVGAAIGVAFAVRAITRFGREAVRVAAEADAIWTRLAGALDTVGVSFQEVEGDIRGLARAMQDATTVGDEDFAMVLTELITTSGKYEESLQNVGVVADLAAAKQIDLRSAAMLVGRAMVGQTATLTRYGIVVEEGADAIEVIRQKFAGMAANEARSLQGQLKQLNNEWTDFKQAIGDVLTAGGPAESMLDRLTEAVKRMERWVRANETQIRHLVNGLVRLGEVAASTAVKILDAFDPVGAEARGIAERIMDTDDIDELRAMRLELASEIRTMSEDLEEQVARWDRIQAEGEGGLPFEFAGTAMDRNRRENEARAAVARTTRRIEAFQDLIRKINEAEEAEMGLGRPTGLPAPDAAPEGAGAGEAEAEDADAVTEALRRKEAALRTIRTMSQLLGSDYDALSAEASVLKSTIKALADEGIGAADPRMQAMRDRLREIEGGIKAVDVALSPLNQTLADHKERMRVTSTLAELTGDEYEALQDRISSLTIAMRELAEQGLDATDPKMQALAEQLRQAREEAGLTSAEMMQLSGVAVAAGDLLGAAFGSGIGDLAVAKAKQNAIMAAEQTVQGIVASANPFTAHLAGVHFTAAAKFAAISAAWAGLAGATGGFSGGGGGASAGGVAGRGTGQGQSERAQPAGNELHVYFVGPGFDAVNPEVQRVVHGAIRESEERVGPNAKVRIHRRRRAASEGP